MRNSTSGTSKTTNAPVQDESSSSKNAAEKANVKKMKQARLPFKVIASGTASVDTTPVQEKGKGSQEQTTEARKRKLSNDEPANEGSTIMDGDAKLSKENLKIQASVIKKKKISDTDNSPEVISLLEEDDAEDDHSSSEDMANSSVSDVKQVSASSKTPKANVKNERKSGARTPQPSSSVQKDKIAGSTSKLQIKLPVSAVKKNKRKKLKLQQLTHNASGTEEPSSHNSIAPEFSSDEIEEIAVELNPQKRKKPNEDCDEKENETKCITTQDVETITLNSESEEEKDEMAKEKPKGGETKLQESKKNLSRKEKLKNKSFFEPNDQENKKQNESTKQCRETRASISSSRKDASTTACSEKTEEATKVLKSSDDIKDTNEKMDMDVSAQSDNDNEADDERDNISAKAVNISSEVNDDEISNLNSTLEKCTKSPSNINATGKPQTPKQVKLMEQRKKVREEKERKLQEEKMKKQQEKEERELAKKREREEKEEQKRKEREEKEDQKRKEREEKERKRLAELEAKNEEKRKRNEAKEEELRKKEEERKRKEQEKEEAEIKKRKAAQAFTKFFVAKTPTNNQPKNDEDSNTGDGTKLLAFRPFQVKGDMKLAPVCRKIFRTEHKSRLDNLLNFEHKTGDDGDDENADNDIVCRKPLAKSQLYLSELRSGKIVPGKWRRPSTESKDDVIIVEDELERVGQAIVEDVPAYIREQMRVKFYKFHDNRRPPYYGTWRKKSSVVKPRRPFALDKKIFDYEVDSDDEWEEEEPGESLEDGSDDDKEKESEDDDYEVDNEWFVPHGHLSDEELQNEDEYGMGDDNTREAQKVKLQILQQEFAQEMKKKTEKIKPRLIGCIWADINGNKPADCANILWDALERKAVLYTDPPLVEELETEKSADPTSPTSAINGNPEKPIADKLKPITLSDNMIKDLTRLIHGNSHSKNFLINEYIAYVEKTEDSVKNGDLRKPLKSVIRDKIDEIAEWQVVNASASTVQDMEQNIEGTTESNKKKKKGKRRLCWVVKQEILDKMNLSSLELQNSWQYTLSPKYFKVDKDVKAEENVIAATKTTECITKSTTDTLTDTARGKEKNTISQIRKFTTVLTAEEKTKKFNNPSENSAAEIKSHLPCTSQPHSKDKKRVPLLVSVARGQQISTPAKNKLISQFLQQKAKGKEEENTQKTSSPSIASCTNKAKTSRTMEDDDNMVILD